METKWCPKCQQLKPVGEFYRNPARKSDCLSPYCVPCSHVAQKATRDKLRDELLSLFGKTCARCAFSDVRALEVDHVNGKGSVHRRSTSSTSRQFIDDIKADMEEYQLLCANCHSIKTHEAKEWTGNRIERVLPTQKEIGIGSGNAPEQRSALEKARTPEAQSEKAKKRWANITPEEAEANSEAIRARRIGTKRVYNADGGWHYSKPGDPDYPLAA